MAVVIRLQGLPVIAGSADIRQYFTGLTIPHGGVHIIGGILGEAFIVFASDEHARRAISRSGGVIQGSRILLFLSSRAEMQYAIEMSHRLAEQEGAQDFVTAMKQGSYVVPSYSVNSVSMNTNGSWYNSSPYYDQSRKNPTCNPTVYLFVCGMPLSVTEKDIRGFFHGLHVSGIVLLKNPQGQITGNGLVKFSSPEEAIKGLKHNKQYMGSRSVDISLATEGQWLAAGGIVGAAGTDDVPKKSPKKSHKKSRGHSRSRSRSPKKYRSRSRSPSRTRSPKKYRSRSHSPSRTRSPKKYRSRSRSPRRQEFCIHMKNLSYRVEKEDIKKFFKGSELTDDQIKFIYDEKHNRKREAFIVFKKELDYFNALCLHKETLNYCSTYIFPITKKAMLEKLDEFKKKTEQAGRRDRKKNLSNEGSSSSSRRTCLYVRNLPCDARKEDVQKFFKGFDIPSDDIQLLCDNVGMGLGEALVKFKSEEKALKAELLNRKKFLETEVLLRLITEEQMKKLSVNILPELSKRPSRPLDDPGNEQMKKLSVNIMPELSKRPSRPMDDPGNEQIKKLSVNIQPELPERPSWLFNDLGNEQMKKLNVNILPELSERPSRPLDDPGNGQMKKLSVNIMPELSQRPSRALDDPGSFKPVPPVNDLYGRFDTGNRMIGYPEGVFNPQADTRQNVVNMNSFTPVKLQNLPYKVTIDEIIDFFYGYPVLRESFAARTNDDGTEAVIFLKSYEEARAAVQELNDKPIGKRKIRVSFL